MKVLIAIFLISSIAYGATATVFATGDNTVDAWVTVPLWEKIDEPIDSPGGDVITSPNNPGSTSNDVVFNVTCPANTGTITEANLRIRASKVAGARTVSFAVSWSATATTNFNTGALGAMANYASGNKTGLSISKATCDTSTIRVSPTTTGGGAGTTASIDGFQIDIVYSVQTNVIGKMLISDSRRKR